MAQSLELPQKWTILYCSLRNLVIFGLLLTEGGSRVKNLIIITVLLLSIFPD